MKITKWRGSKDPLVIVHAEILHEIYLIRSLLEDSVERLIVALSRVS